MIPKINFKQPKYIFPAVIVVPLAALIFFLCQIFGGSSENVQVATDHINSEIPDADLPEYSSDKLSEMNRRYREDDSYTAIESIGQEIEQKESIDNELENSEKEYIEKMRQAQQEQLQMQRLQNQLERSRSRINDDYSSPEDYRAQMERINRQQVERMRILNGEPDPQEVARAEAEQKAREEAARKAKEEAQAPAMVVKATETTNAMFNTVSSADSPLSDTPLIKAMIDQTTKASEGTRLRFKLLDDVVVKDVMLPKGTYLYGTVSGFGDQRVKAKITNILIGSKFLKVDLSVFDNDGMEGFYIPASTFRDFMKEAGSSVAGQNISINNNSSSDGFNAEMIALQALQNIYSAGSQALSSNIRKNKAKIKYNTIVYLINSNQSR